MKQLLEAVLIQRHSDMAQAGSVKRLVAVIGDFGVLLRELEQLVEVGNADVRQDVACTRAGQLALIDLVPLTVLVLDIDGLSLRDFGEGIVADAAQREIERALIGQHFVAVPGRGKRNAAGEARRGIAGRLAGERHVLLHRHVQVNRFELLHRRCAIEDHLPGCLGTGSAAARAQYEDQREQRQQHRRRGEYLFCTHRSRKLLLFTQQFLKVCFTSIFQQ